MRIYKPPNKQLVMSFYAVTKFWERCEFDRLPIYIIIIIAELWS